MSKNSKNKRKLKATENDSLSKKTESAKSTYPKNYLSAKLNKVSYRKLSPDENFTKITQNNNKLKTTKIDSKNNNINKRLEKDDSFEQLNSPNKVSDDEIISDDSVKLNSDEKSNKRLRLSSDSDSSSNQKDKPITVPNSSKGDVNLNLTSKSSIEISKIAASHALIYWPEPERKFSVISIYAIRAEPEELIKEGGKYRIFFQNNEYLGIVRKIGSKIECNAILNDIVGEPSCSKKKISLSPLRNDKDKGICENETKFSQKIENENVRLKQKILDLTEALEKEKEKNDTLNTKKDNLSISLELYQQTFGNNEEVSLPLSDKFYDIFVPESNLILINDCIDDRSVFRKNTATEIKTIYSKKVNAVLSLVKERDSKFSAKRITDLIN
ncbi:unnamed protein product [Brachionus calyciflorus]|uniref:BEN domain-containing protein n=1 Tax=Brachionus calyciflorus TaxID=104777 RepID=A0A814BFW3_9BILA|nr:unnamed protein product [Brachionus calyciflorus]